MASDIHRPRISLIAAVARNGVIGRDNGLIWRLGSDLRRFKALTMGKPVLMGRKTYESIGRPLPGRRILVLTRDRSFSAADVAVVHDWAGALAAAGEAEELMVAGAARSMPWRCPMPTASTSPRSRSARRGIRCSRPTTRGFPRSLACRASARRAG